MYDATRRVVCIFHDIDSFRCLSSLSIHSHSLSRRVVFICKIVRHSVWRWFFWEEFYFPHFLGRHKLLGIPTSKHEHWPLALNLIKNQIKLEFPPRLRGRLPFVNSNKPPIYLTSPPPPPSSFIYPNVQSLSMAGWLVRFGFKFGFQVASFAQNKITQIRRNVRSFLLLPLTTS